MGACYGCNGCGKCREWIEEIRGKCPKCKEPFHSGDRICRACGAELPLPPGMTSEKNAIKT